MDGCCCYHHFGVGTYSEDERIILWFLAVVILPRISKTSETVEEAPWRSRGRYGSLAWLMVSECHDMSWRTISWEISGRWMEDLQEMFGLWMIWWTRKDDVNLQRMGYSPPSWTSWSKGATHEHLVGKHACLVSSVQKISILHPAVKKCGTI